jgi:hypothetical protein
LLIYPEGYSDAIGLLLFVALIGYQLIGMKNNNKTQQHSAEG